MRKKILILVFVIASFLLVSCPLDVEEEEDFSTLVLCSWNVQNLFDGKDNGNEYDEYLSSSGWSDKQYRIRLGKIETVLGYGELLAAKVIVLNEVENEDVVSDLLSLSSLRDRGFEYYACAGEKDGAIKTAVISCYPIVSARTHSSSGIRPVLEVNLNVCGRTVCVLAVHAKSNRGEEEENVELRSTTGRIIREISDSVLTENPSAIVAVAGDFNESASSSNVLSEYFRWYVFWEDSSLTLDAPGSYYYDGQWLQYDNIALSCGALSGGVETSGILSTIYGYPNVFSKSLLSGVSDHYPVWVKIEL
ncbi:MAG: hypothetical protein K6F82_03425 [Sphaerochaetaceae bacterium]|nr:hypothetical protein [Sphaerochaetaceae bacterium]